MPTNPQRPGETREMRLFGRVIELSRRAPDRSLPEFIARRRAPGPSWRSWDELSFDLTEVVGEIVTVGTLGRWSKRYGIPEGTQSDGSIEQYREAIARSGIVIS